MIYDNIVVGSSISAFGCIAALLKSKQKRYTNTKKMSNFWMREIIELKNFCKKQLNRLLPPQKITEFTFSSNLFYF